MNTSNSHALDIFIRESMNQSPPTEDEEKALAIRIRAGDESAKDELAVRNTRLAMHIAKKYRGHGIDLSDLVQGSSIAVYESIRTFNHEKGYRFASWATWYIKNALKALLSTNSHAVSFPIKNCNHVEARRAIDEMKAELGRLPTTQEFEARNSMPGHVVQVIDSLYQKPIALDAPLGDIDDGRALVDNLISCLPDTDSDAMIMSDKKLITRILAGLTDRERDIITRRFGLFDTDPEPLHTIGLDHCITRERTRQIQVEATAKMASINRMIDNGGKAVSIFDVR